MDETRAFYQQTLGLADSDDLRLPPPAEGAPDQRILFLHADNPRHHSLGLYNFPVPTGIIHMIFEMPEIDDVGLCLDRVNAAGLPLLGTLGRHCNDQMLSFYVFGPGGIGVEIGCGGLQVDWQNFTPTVSTVGDVWGHVYTPVV
jgi:3,4-dihydroxy-9,10-secoandrosta-1,3,5(10)-triene-9,17-dione 4,5-dioxygenase